MSYTVTLKNTGSIACISAAILIFSGCMRTTPGVVPGVYESQMKSSGDVVGRGTAYIEKRVVTANIIEVNGVPLEIETAKTPEEKARGLSGRSMLAEGKGMLFPYGSPTTPSFWMKDMYFSIDILWIREGSVVDITSSIPFPDPLTPTPFLPVYSPRGQVDHVLEVPAGWSEKNGVVIGSIVKIPDLTSKGF